MRSVFAQLLTVAIALHLLACREGTTIGTVPPGMAAAGSGAMMPAATGIPGAPAANANPLIVKVEDGELEGALNEAADVRSFLGIPYAKPPVGELRWKEPQRNTPWTGVRSAKDFGGRCAQLDSAVLMNKASDTEDCLYLNVWTPAPPAPGAKLPVMFWIHGGGNVNGSTNEPVPYLGSGLFYTGEFLAKKGVIIVSLNYRLGVFGFLSHAGLTAEGSKSGNQGLWDQQAAMSWVQRNIASFGGDPSNVTIFGESAGSLDVCLHVASPKSRGLFHKAVSESGGCTTFQATAATAQMTTDKLAAAVGCSGADTLACLRSKPVSQLLTAIPSGAGTGGFGPNVDGEFFPKQPRQLFDSGDIAKVPYILGSNTDEGTLFTVATTVTSEDAYKAAIMTRYPAIVDKVLAFYPVSKFMSAMNPFNAALARAFGDGALVCSTWDTATRAAKAGAPVYMYNFDIPVSVGTNLGATHGSELVYVFGTSPALTDEQKKVSELMQSYWTNLAKAGDPNGASLVQWPKFSEAMDTRVNFSLMPSPVQNFRSEECKFWREQYDLRFAAEGS
ncbi:MAG TPA: carboxylesterase/lipase family protein [Polyangiales bacterium]|nr:carboxylesterase/lipase family protein [Polyangiales bacterium]